MLAIPTERQLEDIERVMQPLAQRKHIHLQPDRDKNLPDSFIGDKARFASNPAQSHCKMQ